MIELLQSILEAPWKPVSRPALVAWLIFYVWFAAYAFSAHGGFLFIDSANLVVHEGGHNLFGWFGPTLGLWGGTLLQWLVPFLLAIYFFKERQTTGFVFCSFFFFENWLYTATYMADARAQVLPLVTTGDPDFVEHDFFRIFSNLGVLNHDTQIAGVVRLLGWCGMIACVIWLASRLRAKDESRSVPITFPMPSVSLIQRYPGKLRTTASAMPGQNIPGEVK
ncbi:MAG: hypothetical protein DMG79_16730 [Acidobacteria bacterium]|nr:MAG: hypothetical protein DMG79_16730 [Acidobacteriota bacterium]